MKIKIDNYTFDKNAKTITFTDYVTIDLNRILGVINSTTGNIIYTPIDSTLNGTVSGNVLTLDYNTSSMSNTDKLIIYYDNSVNPLTAMELRAVPLHVIVDNQIDLTSIQNTLNNALTKLASIEVNTDTVESKLTDILNEIDANGTVNNTNLLNVITELQGIDANTDGLEASLLSIITNTSNKATESKQDVGNASLSSIDTKTPALVSGRVPVDGSGVTQPVSGSVSITGTPTVSVGNFPATQPVSASSLPLPSGASTESTLSTVASRLPSSFGTRGGLKVENPDQVNFAYSQTGVIAINTDLLVIDCAGLSSLSIQCTSMGTSGVVTAAWSNTGAVNEFPASATLQTPAGANATTFNAVGIWTTQIYGRYLRLRLTTATTAGTTTLSVQGLFGVNNLSVPSQTISGAVTLASTTITSISAGTNAVGDVGLQVRANATGAPTVTTLNSPATPALQTIKASAGRILSFNVSNTNASPRYIKVFNTTTVTLGTTSASFEIMIPANNAVRDIVLPLSIGMSAAIAVVITGNKGLTDNTAITLNDVSGFITFA